MSNDPQGELKPISPARVAEELNRLCTRRAKGEIKPDEFEHRFARMISELRDRRVDGNRADVMAALEPVRAGGLVTDRDCQRLLAQLGIA